MTTSVAAGRAPRLAVLFLLLLTPSCSMRRVEGPSASAANVNVPELLVRADELYARRESVENVREALDLLRQARAGDYGDFDVVWKIAMFNYYLGGHGRDEDERQAAFVEGIKAGELAVGLAPDRPEGHFWLGANKGGLAQLRGALHALSSVGDVRSEMEKVIAIDPGFQGGSAFMALAQVDLELPELLGGDSRRALETLERGLPYGGENSFYRLRLAQAYYENGRKAEARAQINYILKMKPHPDYLPEYRDSAAQARRLAEKLK